MTSFAILRRTLQLGTSSCGHCIMNNSAFTQRWHPGVGRPVSSVVVSHGYVETIHNLFLGSFA